MPTPRTIDEYIAGQPQTAQPGLKKIRAAVKKAVPKAEEVISYQIPAFRLSGRVGLFFAAWSSHLSMYPVSDAVKDELKPELIPYLASLKSLHFPLSKPLPLALIQKIAKVRAKELAAMPPTKRSLAAKKAKAKAKPKTR